MIIARYFIAAVLRGYVIVTLALLALFGLFAAMEEAGDVGEAGYDAADAMLFVAMSLPATLLDLVPFVILLGTIFGLSGFLRTLELLSLRAVGMSAFGVRPALGAERAARLAAYVVRRAVLPAALLFAGGVLAFLHFQSGLDTGAAALRFNQDGFIGASHALRHFGLFALLTLAWVAAVVSRPAAPGVSGSRRRSVALLLSGAIASFLLVPSIDRLEKRGLVVRARTPNDRRFYALQLSPAGQQLLARAVERVELQERAMAAALRPGERSAMIDMLQRVEAALAANGEARDGANGEPRDSD